MEGPPTAKTRALVSVLIQLNPIFYGVFQNIKYPRFIFIIICIFYQFQYGHYYLIASFHRLLPNFTHITLIILAQYCSKDLWQNYFILFFLWLIFIQECSIVKLGNKSRYPNITKKKSDSVIVRYFLGNNWKTLLNIPTPGFEGIQIILFKFFGNILTTIRLIINIVLKNW